MKNLSQLFDLLNTQRTPKDKPSEKSNAATRKRENKINKPPKKDVKKSVHPPSEQNSNNLNYDDDDKGKQELEPNELVLSKSSEQNVKNNAYFNLTEKEIEESKKAEQKYSKRNDIIDKEQRILKEQTKSNEKPGTLTLEQAKALDKEEKAKTNTQTKAKEVFKFNPRFPKESKETDQFDTDNWIKNNIEKAKITLPNNKKHIREIELKLDEELMLPKVSTYNKQGLKYLQKKVAEENTKDIDQIMKTPHIDIKEEEDAPEKLLENEKGKQVKKEKPPTILDDLIAKAKKKPAKYFFGIAALVLAATTLFAPVLLPVAFTAIFMTGVGLAGYAVGKKVYEGVKWFGETRPGKIVGQGITAVGRGLVNVAKSIAKIPQDIYKGFKNPGATLLFSNAKDEKEHEKSPKDKTDKPTLKKEAPAAKIEEQKVEEKSQEKAEVTPKNAGTKSQKQNVVAEEKPKDEVRSKEENAAVKPRVQDVEAEPKEKNVGAKSPWADRWKEKHQKEQEKAKNKPTSRNK